MKKILSFLFLFFSIISPASTLYEKQIKFSHLAALLILHAEEKGFDVTLGEAWRSVEMASFETQYYAKHGKGIVDSLHIKRLAIDLNLFKDGKYLVKTSDYQELGIWWEKQGTKDFQTVWGGRFKRLVDANHFSLSDEGVK